MKKKKEKVDNTIINNLYKETIETIPEDGFVSEKEIRPVKMQHYGKDNIRYHKGNAKTVIYTTNDPRITRPFTYGVCGIFLAIGIFMLLLQNWFFGIIFTVVAIFGLIKSKKDIDKVSEELKNKGQDVTIDSAEEKEQLKNEVSGIFKQSVKDVTLSTFTKDKYKKFVKVTIPIYCAISTIIVILISIFVNIFLGLFILIVLGLSGLLYYYLISNLFKN